MSFVTSNQTPCYEDLNKLILQVSPSQAGQRKRRTAAAGRLWPLWGAAAVREGRWGAVCLSNQSWLLDCLFGWWFETQKDSFRKNLYESLYVLWLFWVFVCHLLLGYVFVVEWRRKKWPSCMRDGTYCSECWFFYWQKKASAIKGQWSDTWLQAMVWNTRLGARRSQVGREEGPQLRQKQELLIFSTIDSLQRSYNNWQHACVIFPIRDNMYHGVKYFFLLWSWISSI